MKKKEEKWIVLADPVVETPRALGFAPEGIRTSSGHLRYAPSSRKRKPELLFLPRSLLRQTEQGWEAPEWLLQKSLAEYFFGLFEWLSQDHHHNKVLKGASFVGVATEPLPVSWKMGKEAERRFWDLFEKEKALMGEHRAVRSLRPWG
jgi:hypothetical protein